MTINLSSADGSFIPQISAALYNTIAAYLSHTVERLRWSEAAAHGCGALCRLRLVRERWPKYAFSPVWSMRPYGSLDQRIMHRLSFGLPKQLARILWIIHMHSHEHSRRLQDWNTGDGEWHSKYIRSTFWVCDEPQHLKSMTKTWTSLMTLNL